MRENLKKARHAAGYTQQQIADRIGISQRYYQNIERGDRDGNFTIWDSLEDLLGVHQRKLREKNHDQEANQGKR